LGLIASFSLFYIKLSVYSSLWNLSEIKFPVCFSSSEFLILGTVSVSFLLSGFLSGEASLGLIASFSLFYIKLSVYSSLWNLSEIKFPVCFSSSEFLLRSTVSVSFLLSGVLSRMKFYGIFFSVCWISMN